MEERTEKRTTGTAIWQIAVVIGGALAVLAAFLTWGSARVAAATGRGAGPGQGAQGQIGGRLARGILRRLFPSGIDRSVSGVHTADGRVVLALGIALLAMAALAALSRWPLQRAAVGGVSAALGAVVLAVAAATATTSPNMGLPPVLSRFLAVQAKTGIGVYLAIAAGAVALVAGAWALLSAPPATAALTPSGGGASVPPPPQSPPPVTTAPTEVIPTIPPEA